MIAARLEMATPSWPVAQSRRHRVPLKPPAWCADAPNVLRARMSLSLIGLIVLVILTVMGARACRATSPSSTSNPINVANNGLAGLCANAQAVAAAGGADPATSAATLVSPSYLQQLQKSDPNGLKALEQEAGGSLACPTTTIPGTP